MNVTRSYPWVRESIQAQIQGCGLQRFSKSRIGERIYSLPIVQQHLSNLSVHAPDAARLFRESLPRIIGDEIQHLKRTIYGSKGRDGANKRMVFARIRLYPSYVWLGDVFYQHLDGISPEVAQLMLDVKRQNRRAVEKQERIMSLVVEYLVHHNCMGVSVDWDAIVNTYELTYNRQSVGVPPLP